MNQDLEILKYLAKKDKQIEKYYKNLIYQLSKVSLSIRKINEGAFFSFDDYPEIKKKVDAVLDSYRKEQQHMILDGIKDAVKISFKVNTAVLSEFSRLSDKALRDMRDDAVNSFIQTRMKPKEGLSLSQKVWNYTRQAKAEFEAGMSEILEDGMSVGMSAEELGRKVRDKLKVPDMVYRRYHTKKLTATGKKDVIEWRRKVIDSEGKVRYIKEDLEKVGRGVYRSSRKNALRLTATEINMAYRYADNARWQAEPFVIGFRIQLSDNHTLNGKPFYDMCDELIGDYPKWFRWAGWHPRCRCIATSILVSKEEMMKIAELPEEEYKRYRSPNLITKMPQNYDVYVEENRDRILASMDKGTSPYWVRDNYKDGDIDKGFYWQRKGKTKFKTDEQKAAIQAAWDLRRRKNAIKAAAEKRHANRNAKAIQEAWDKRKISMRYDAYLEKELGIKKGSPMTFADANFLRGNVQYVAQYIVVEGRYVKNPLYNSANQPYHANCQSCVVANEMRRRGWNVTAVGKTKGSVAETLARHTELAWRTVDDTLPVSMPLRAKRRAKIEAELESIVKQGERYHLKWYWADSNSGHIITVDRDTNGDIRYYDPQNGEIVDIERVIKYAMPTSFRLLRVDNLLPYPLVTEKVVTKLNNRNKVASITKVEKIGGIGVSSQLSKLREDALESDRFYLSEEKSRFNNLLTKKLSRRSKPLKRTLNHIKSLEELEAVEYIWNNPDKMTFIRVSPLGEGKDMTLPQNKRNIKNKQQRGVVAYNLYEFEYRGKTWLIKTEEHKAGFEQFYTLTKKR